MSVKLAPDLPDAETLKEALARLEQTSRPQWGTMTVVQMLAHCARLHDLYLGRVQASRKTRILARLLGRPFIRKSLATSPFHLRRGQRTLPELETGAVTVDGEFEGMRARVLASLDEIEGRSGRWKHPLYGEIDAAVGQALARHHLAHHLHQFGVLEPRRRR